ncbi:MAG: acyl carrier protein [Elusimicrobia bacterium]|nr:acyl carrier protein [Elusimicrobiota bacterium]
MAWEELFEGMKELVADSLAIEADGVTPASSLISDLDADSLDFVDIFFKIEKKFGVKIRAHELNAVAGFSPTAPQASSTPLTPEAIQRLKEFLPNIESAGATLTPAKVIALISVETLCRMVDKKRREAPAPAP